jgi:hypothetical protein
MHSFNPEDIHMLMTFASQQGGLQGTAGLHLNIIHGQGKARIPSLSLSQARLSPDGGTTGLLEVGSGSVD